MKAMNSLRILPGIVLFAICLLLSNLLHAQCPTDVNYGQNLVVNGDFENGYSNWTFTPQTVPWDPSNQGAADGYRVHGSSSLPGDIFVGTNPNTQFNPGFQTFPDHTSGLSTGKYLMVDGVCKLGVKLYSETVAVTNNTNYYFSVWINSLKDNPTNPGVLNFDVGGVNIGANIVAPALGGASAFAGGDLTYGWKKYEVVWNSGSLTGNVAISIENQNTLNCSDQVDFAIDDISFIPGCSYGSPGPVPNLGPDKSLCGTGGSITLNANVPMLSTTTVSWSDGTSNTGANPLFYSKVITAPGTYSVCVVDNGSCIKSDVIVITNTFTPATSPNADLCTTGGSTTLDAVFTGIGTTYQWQLNGSNLPAPSTNRTYTATTAGNYTVAVTVPGCGTVSSGTTVITSSATTAPTTTPNANLCTTNPVPLDAVLTGTGITYQWKLNGTNLPAPSTNRTYSAISPGTYTVDVKLPGCTTTTSGNTVITSSSPVTPVDAFYCANAGVAVPVTLGATGTNSSSFKWYTAAAGGSSVNTGSSYAISIPAGTTATQTYYVQDETVSNGTLGPTTYTNGNNADGTSAWNQNYITITPNGDFTISSLQIPYVFFNPSSAFNITIEVADATGTSFATPHRFTSLNTTTPVTTGASKLYTFNFAGFTILKSWGSTLTLKIFSSTAVNGQSMVSTAGYSGYPYASSIPSVVSIINSKVNNTITTNGGYAYFFNINMSATTICSRIPVRAINNCVTPVTWTSFYLVPQDDNSCKLVWSTANETNNSYFSIVRSSDGINFESIATISGAGNRDISSNYFYVDTEPLSGTSYYYIIQYDFDGKYSSTAMEPYSSQGLIKVTTYPNPFQNNTTLLVSGPDAQTYTYTLYSVNGQLVEQGSGTINQIKTIGETVAKGMYMLTVLTSTDLITAKIVKQ
jgi:hypothetical protein